MTALAVARVQSGFGTAKALAKAAALVHARAATGFADVKALAKASGVPAARLADFEAARGEPTLDELYGLVNSTGLSLDRLFGLVRPTGAGEASGLLHE